MLLAADRVCHPNLNMVNAISFPSCVSGGDPFESESIYGDLHVE